APAAGALPRRPDAGTEPAATDVASARAESRRFGNAAARPRRGCGDRNHPAGGRILRARQWIFVLPIQRKDQVDSLRRVTLSRSRPSANAAAPRTPQIGLATWRTLQCRVETPRKAWWGGPPWAVPGPWPGPAIARSSPNAGQGPAAAQGCPDAWLLVSTLSRREAGAEASSMGRGEQEPAAR